MNFENKILKIKTLTKYASIFLFCNVRFGKVCNCFEYWVSSKVHICKFSNIKHYVCWNAGFSVFYAVVKSYVSVFEFYRVGVGSR
jgi:hypothetical protein